MYSYDDDFYKFKKIVSDRKQKEEEDYKKSSKHRLLKIIEKKFQTTIIGALASFEEHFGHLWGHNKETSLTDEEEHNRYMWDGARTDILNKGNHELRNAIKEMENYDIRWNRYRSEFIVLKKEKKNEEY